MKKILILSIFLLTGCEGVLQGYLVNTCSKLSNTTGLSDLTSYEIHFKEDIINKVNIIYQYEGNEEILNNLKKSYTSSNNYLKDYEELNVTEEDVDGKYIVTYEIDMSKVSSEIKEKFNLLDERSKQVKFLEELGFTCEVK